MSRPPIIGITVNRRPQPDGSVRYECGPSYAQAVQQAGGVPVLLTTHPELIDSYLQLCQGFLFTGGADPCMEPFGKITHPQAQLMDPQRQTFETALLQALQRQPHTPVLGICLGMQMMTLIHHGDLHQHLPDWLGETKAARHAENHTHTVNILAADSHLAPPPASAPATIPVVSWHHQAVSDPGSLRVVAQADDQVIEAVDDPHRPFYVGVQWHPERGGNDTLNLGLIDRLVKASAWNCATEK